MNCAIIVNNYVVISNINSINNNSSMFFRTIITVEINFFNTLALSLLLPQKS